MNVLRHCKNPVEKQRWTAPFTVNSPHPQLWATLVGICKWCYLGLCQRISLLTRCMCNWKNVQTLAGVYVHWNSFVRWWLGIWHASKALSVNTVVIEGNVPTKSFYNKVSSALTDLRLAFCTVSGPHSRCALTIGQMEYFCYCSKTS